MACMENELMALADKTGLDGNYLVRRSRLSAKIDSTAVHACFQDSRKDTKIIIEAYLAKQAMIFNEGAYEGGERNPGKIKEN